MCLLSVKTHSCYVAPFGHFTLPFWFLKRSLFQGDDESQPNRHFSRVNFLVIIIFSKSVENVIVIVIVAFLWFDHRNHDLLDQRGGGGSPGIPRRSLFFLP